MNQTELLNEQISQKKENILLNPFPGLRPFKYEENHLYFGRENQINEVVDKLIKNKFVSIIGTSGIGKSSFIYCGLFPILYGDFPTEHATKWEIYTLRPGVTPIQNMASAIAEGFVKSQKNQYDVEALEQMEYTFLTESSMGLVNSIAHKSKHSHKNYLIFIDQFEELFRFKDLDLAANDQAAAFIKLIANAVNQTEIPIYVVLTMRSDFVGDCSQFPILTQLINNSQFLIPQMTRSEKREAIIGPVKIMDGEIDEALVQQILNDVGDNPDQLPIMQHALMRTWDYWQRTKIGNEALSISDYEAIGGMEKALSIHANEAFNELTDRQKKICEKLFKTITEKGTDGRGIRRPTKLKEIAIIADATPEEVVEVINHFRAIGRTLLMPPVNVVLTEESVIDISHESLMRIWVTLNKWVEEEAESVKLYLRLAEAAEMHQLGKAGLWRGPDLQIALSWYNEEKPSETWGVRYHPAYERTILFLEFSKKEYEREQINKEKLQKRRLIAARIIASVLGLGAVIAILLLLLAEEQRKIAEDQKQLAEVKTKEATEASKVALIESDRARNESEKAKKASERAAKEAEIAQKERANALVKEREATKSAEEARRSFMEAQKQTELAKEQKEIAVKASTQAEIAKKNAYDLRMLSIARTMAIKSQQISDSVSKSVIAQQAFNFQKEYGGEMHDADIYDGLYYALKSLLGDKFNQYYGHTANVRAIVTSGNFMYSAGSDGKIIRWNTDKIDGAPTLLEDNPGLIHRAIAISADGTQMICGGDYSYIRVYDLGNMSKVRNIPITSKEVSYLSFLPKNKGFIGLTEEQEILYSADMAKVRRLLQDKSINRRGNQIIGVHPVSGKVIFGKVGGAIMGFDVDKPTELMELYHDANNADIVSVCFSNSGRWLVAGTEQGRIKLIDLQTNAQPVAFTIRHKARVNKIAFSKDDKLMATGSFDATVKIWDFANRDIAPIVLKDHKDWVWSIAFNPKGDKLLAGCKDQIVRVWPTKLEAMTGIICEKINRNMTKEEWKHYVSEEIPYVKTCDNYPENNK